MDKTRGVIRPLLAAAALAASAAACGPDEPTSRSGTLVVTPASLVMGLGTSRQLSVTVLDGAGAPVSGATVSFVSSDPRREQPYDRAHDHQLRGEFPRRIGFGYSAAQPGRRCGWTTIGSGRAHRDDGMRGLPWVDWHSARSAHGLARDSRPGALQNRACDATPTGWVMLLRWG